MGIKERFLEFISYKGLSKRKFQESIGVSNSYIQNISSGISADVLYRIANAYSELNTDWLLTGEGNMLKKDDKTILRKDVIEKGENNYKLVPIVHIDSVGGMRSNNSITDESQYIEGYIPFVNAQDDDKAIFQSGTSMIPTIPPGSIMQLREVKNWREYFGYGNIFVIELTDGRRITKEVRRYDENSKDYVLCVSHNPDVAPEELPKSMIASVWKVIKILTDKGW